MAGVTNRPLDGIRVLALEQMQALPFATQLLTRLGAEVVKIEPISGDQGRASTPAITDPDGRAVGATFLRNNLNKRSVCVDLKNPAGRNLVLQLARQFDVFAENSKAGAMQRLGLGYDAVREVHPTCVYLSISGFGTTTPTPYQDWPAFAPVVEAMSGIYDWKRPDDTPPVVAPSGALGDISAALFATVGILAALRQRDRTGAAQLVDVAMYDAMVALADIIPNFWSLGLRRGGSVPIIQHAFRAQDGYFIVQAGREHQFARLVELIGHPEWVDDPRFATRQGWLDQLDDVLRPAIETWAAARTKLEACNVLSAAGIAAGPCYVDEEVVRDAHLRARNMLVEMDRPDGVDQPVLIPGNPVKIRGVPDGPDGRVPWLGEHTRQVLATELGLAPAEIDDLYAAGVIA
jgi:crotonobetainyl-CoA:carnitine CoA-transferase CaiB-like acyl-CoA transferase